MKEMELLADKIAEELNYAERYIRLALEYRDELPAMSKTFYDLSNDEMNHANLLHKQTVQLIDEYRRNHGDPPADMQSIYDYLHKKHMEHAHDIRIWQDSYK
jgi:ferritin